MFDIDEALRYLVDHEGSDLHIKVPAPPMIRVHGALSPIPGYRIGDRGLFLDPNDRPLLIQRIPSASDR